MERGRIRGDDGVPAQLITAEPQKGRMTWDLELFPDKLTLNLSERLFGAKPINVFIFYELSVLRNQQLWFVSATSL